jgi:DNA-binding ferritin-like protein (Dps family)
MFGGKILGYLYSMEYKTDKEQLTGEYQNKYIMIERFYKSLYSSELYEVQVTLKQILHEFLLSQKEERSLETVTGDNIEKYAVNMIKAEKDKNKSIMSRVNNVVMFIMGVLYLMLLKSFSRLPLGSFYFCYVEVLIIIIVLVLDYLKNKIINNMFYHYKLILVTKILIGLAIFLFNYYLFYLYNYKINPEEIEYAINIPPVIFITLIIVLSIYGLALLLIHEDRTHAKKMKLLEESENEFK